MCVRKLPGSMSHFKSKRRTTNFPLQSHHTGAAPAIMDSRRDSSVSLSSWQPSCCPLFENMSPYWQSWGWEKLKIMRLSQHYIILQSESFGCSGHGFSHTGWSKCHRAFLSDVLIDCLIQKIHPKCIICDIGPGTFLTNLSIVIWYHWVFYTKDICKSHCCGASNINQKSWKN